MITARSGWGLLAPSFTDLLSCLDSIVHLFCNHPPSRLQANKFLIPETIIHRLHYMMPPNRVVKVGNPVHVAFPIAFVQTSHGRLAGLIRDLFFLHNSSAGVADTNLPGHRHAYVEQ